MSDKQLPETKLSPVKQALAEIRRLKRELARAEGSSAEPIAVVGMGVRLPGVGDEVESLHGRLVDKIDAIGEIPSDRWDVDAFFDPKKETPGHMYTREGGFLPDVRGFDPEFFGIAPFEAASVDPQHRLLLEVAWEALEHAGISPTSLRGSHTGVFLGMSATDYNRLALGDAASVDAYASVGTAMSVAAGRIAYLLDVRGPAMAIDTACSSSLVATCLAARSLASGESKVALVGGVNLILGPEVTINFCQAGMLAPDGRCKTFDDDADGYVRSEGCVVVVLKRLVDAERDGDRVLAVIRGGALNQDGRSSGITAPNGPAQEAVLRAALSNAGVEPDQIGYVEAHGTGTSLGDPIELQALGAVFGNRSPDDPLWVGSAKTNFGHLEAAAGLLGLVKVVESLRRREIPPHLHFRKPNAHVPWAELPISVPTGRIPFAERDGTRLAGVSSFGFSGTNAHLILEQAPEPAAPPEVEFAEPALHVLPLSADRDDALRQLAARYVDLLGKTTSPLADICYTAGIGRAHLSHRLAVVAADKRAAGEALERWLADGGDSNVVAGEVEGSIDVDTGLAFVFGEPAELPSKKLAAFFESSPVTRGVLEECDAVLGDNGVRDALRAGSEIDPSAMRVLAVAGQIAIARQLQSWGLDPDIVVGGGSGSIAAATIAGALAGNAAIEVARTHLASEESRAAADSSSAPWTRTPSKELFLAADDGAPRPVRAADDPSRWSAALRAVPDLDLATDLLLNEGASRIVVIGSTGGQVEPAVENETERVGHVTMTIGGQPADLSAAALRAMAKLYSVGAEVDWAFVHAGHHRHRVSLPTYPFQRRPFWLPERAESEPRRPAVDPAVAASRVAKELSPFDAALVAATEKAALAPIDLNISTYPQKWDALGELTRILGNNLLASPDIFSDDQQRDLDVVLSRGSIKPLYAPIVRRWLDAMVDAGALERVGTGWRAATAPSVVDTAPAWAEVERVLHDNEPLLAYVRNCAQQLEGVLTGSVSPLETLFPNGKFDLAVDLYERATQLRYINGIAASVLETWVRERLPTGAIRVLEVGAGTGGTTTSLLPALPAERTTYDYTDVSDIFLEFSRERFPDVAFLRPRRFDMELDAEDQGFEPGSYHVVAASNVVHAARDLRAALRRVRSLLAPGGMLLMVESTGHLAWHDITTGLIEGWQHFTDDLRADTPLLDVESWRSVLEEEGFVAVGAAPGTDSSASVLAQHVVFAVAPGEHVSGRAARSGDVASATRAGASVVAAAADNAASDVEPGSLAVRLSTAVASEREQVAADAVRACVVEVLRADPGRPPGFDARLMELGLDSLMAVRLRNEIQERLGLPFSLPSTLMFDYPTVRHIARLILERLDGAGPGAEASPASEHGGAADGASSTTATSGTHSQREAEIAGLTDEEVEALLVNRLDAGESR